MKLKQISLTKSLNKAFQKQSLKRCDIERFKTELQNMFNLIDEKQMIYKIYDFTPNEIEFINQHDSI